MQREEIREQYPCSIPSGGPLSKREIEERMQVYETRSRGKNLKYAAVSQRGYYPGEEAKANQDKYTIQEIGDALFFGVFDGHGPTGDKCASFARDTIVNELNTKKIGKKISSIKRILSKVHLTTNKKLAANKSIDDAMSGTTSCCVFLKDDTELLVSNLGDSRAMFAKFNQAPLALSRDHTPYLASERSRIKKKGAFIMSADQVDGVIPYHENWTCNLGQEIDTGGDPPRVWHRSLQWPGTAFTRSIGDSMAEKLGVCAQPEFQILNLQHCQEPCDLIIASDGIFEFITMQTCLKVVQAYDDPLDACKALTAKAYQLWIQKEDRTDDITCIVLKFNASTEHIPPTTTTKNSQTPHPPPETHQSSISLPPATKPLEQPPVLKRGRRGTILTPLAPIAPPPKANTNKHRFISLFLPSSSK